MPKKKKKIFVGMSGGVDSSAAAALLKKAGFDVTGIYLKCWSEGPACTSEDDERSARLAASHLGVPFYVWNFIDQYKARVVDYMLQGYRQGITPNPDVMCNREIKFGLFYQRAMELGADAVATGHYVRRERRGGGVVLLKGKDPEKDQSYFLAFVNPAVLERSLFPVGNYTKQEVRAFARKIGLPNADRKDSQGICFVGKVEVGEFLRLHIPAKKGEIVTTAGKVVGQHEGSWYYTIGQRQGLRLAGGPYYVAEKNVETNTLVVSREENDVVKSATLVRDINWFVLPQKQERVAAKFRYRQEDVPVTVNQLDETTWQVIPETPQRAITPGQFAVLYRGDELLGGGVIA